MRPGVKRILKDILLLGVSVIAAVLLAKSNFFERLFASAEQWRLLGSFIAGLGFASLFTIAPATVALAKIAQANHILPVALVGGFGSLISDYLIFRFVRKNVTADFKYLARRFHLIGYLKFFRASYLRWLGSLLGAIIVASPLPDELGLSLMGISEMRLRVFLPLTYAIDVMGVAIVAYIAKAL